MQLKWNQCRVGDTNRPVPSAAVSYSHCNSSQHWAVQSRKWLRWCSLYLTWTETDSCLLWRTIHSHSCCFSIKGEHTHVELFQHFKWLFTVRENRNYKPYNSNVNRLCNRQVIHKERKSEIKKRIRGKHNNKRECVLFFFLQMNIIAGGFYDGLMLYTHALNETMSMFSGQPPGKVVTKRMWNRTFHGECIFNMSVWFYIFLCFV